MNVLAIVFLITLGLHALACLQVNRNANFTAATALLAWCVGAAISIIELAT
jgi:hypothetical protein